MPTVLLLAGILAAEGVSFVLVGSGALRLRGESLPVRDVDAVIEPERANLRRLLESLSWLALDPAAPPGVSALRSRDMTSVLTSYGRLDCLLRRGRLEWRTLSARADVIEVAGAGVMVASTADAWRLRRAFKDQTT
jgi:hypothetical protein